MCFSEQWMAEVLEKVYTHFNVRQDAEISIEANPGTVDYGKTGGLPTGGN